MATELDDSKWREQISKLAALLPKAFTDDVLRTEAKEFVRKTISFLPPKTMSQGRAAVARDIGRAIRILDPKSFTDPRVRKIMLSGDVQAIWEYCQTVPQLANLVVQLFDPSLHTNVRSRYGHVSESTRPVLVPQPDLVKSYTRRVQDRVGLLKAGYVPAAAELGLSLPGWITKHASASLGAIAVAVAPINGLSVITITHRSGKWPDHARMARDALRSRTEAIRTKVLRTLRGQAVNLGFKT